MPSLPIDWAEAETFLQAIGRNGSTLARLFPPKGIDDQNRQRLKGDHRSPGRQFRITDRDAIQRAHDEGRGLYAVINPGGGRKSEITSAVAYWAEFDDRPDAEQLDAVELSAMPPPSLVTTTGGKSLHFYWILREPVTDLPQWQADMNRIADHLGSDPAVCDPSRVMRLPGGHYLDADLQPIGRCTIVHQDPDARYSRAEIIDALPPLTPEPDEPDGPLLTEIGAAAAGGGGGGDSRTLEDIREALACVPQRWPGSYEEFRNLLWGLGHALAEIGHDPAQAIALMEEHSPSRTSGWDIAQVFASGGDRSATAAWFWGICRQHGADVSAITRRRLRSERPQAALPTTSAPKAGAAPQQQAQPQKAGATASLADLRGAVRRLLDSDTPAADRLLLLRAAARDLDLPARDSDLVRLLAEERRKRAGAVTMVTQGQRLNSRPVPWLWEGLVISEATTLLVAPPKIGKTSLLLACIAAWHQGAPSFMGQPLHGPCPPVLLVGTDMPEGDWATMLTSYGLASHDGTLLAPIVGLFHAGAPLHLDPDGISRISQLCEANPGMWVVVDSYHRCASPLGLLEKDESYAGPLYELQEAVAPYRATLTVIHHAGRTRAGQGPVASSRGTTALPAACSQVACLNRLAPDRPDDRRLVLEAEGRGGNPVRVMLERDRSSGWWVHLGAADDVEQAQRLEAAEADLSDRQADALEVVRDRWEDGQQGTTAMDVASALAMGGSDPRRVARKALDSLERVGLVVSTRATIPGRGSATEYRPANTPESVSGETHSNPSDPRGLVSVHGSIGSDGSDGLCQPVCQFPDTNVRVAQEITIGSQLFQGVDPSDPMDPFFDIQNQGSDGFETTERQPAATTTPSTDPGSDGSDGSTGSDGSDGSTLPPGAPAWFPALVSAVRNHPDAHPFTLSNLLSAQGIHSATAPLIKPWLEAAGAAAAQSQP